MDETTSVGSERLYLKILIVDEHAPSIAVLSHALTLRGHTCDGAGSAEDALARIVSFRPQVVVYEWNMSRDGRGLAKRMRAVSTSALTIIALSTIDEPDGFREIEQVDVYLMKPFDIARLESVLHGV